MQRQWRRAGGARVTFRCMKMDAVRRSSSVTELRAVFGRRAACAQCHNGADYEVRCDMACCKPGRRSKRRRRNNPVLQRADCGTGATPGPVAQTTPRNWPIAHDHLQLAIPYDDPTAPITRALCNEESVRCASAKSIRNLIDRRLELLQLHRYVAAS